MGGGADKDEYERRFLAAVLETKEAKIWFSNAIPPYVRVMRKFGLRPRPPHYVDLKTVFIRCSITFVSGWALVMSLFVWDFATTPLWYAAFFSLTMGLFCASFLTLYYRYGRETHELSAWEDL